jgi:hypothetical protein
VRGVAGGLRGLLILALACLLLAPLPPVLTSYLNRGKVDLDAFLPHRAVSASSPSRLVRIDGTPSQQAAVRSALDELAWPVDPKAFTVRIVPHGKLADDPGMYLGPDRVIEIDAEIADDPVMKDLAHLLAHEVGHSIDLTKLDDEARAQFMELRGIDPRQDWQDSRDAWDGRPQEDFAEVFAALDSPASVTPIRTFGGRMTNEKALRKFMARYQPGPMRPRQVFTLSTVSSLIALEVGVVLGDAVWTQILIALALANMTFSAMRSMGRRLVPVRLRRRRCQ